jgi:hypothetical protein
MHAFTIFHKHTVFIVRKGNIDAMEKALWEEELSLHAVDTAVAESAVLRQRQVDWKYRADKQGHAYAMLSAQYPFVATVVSELK